MKRAEKGLSSFFQIIFLNLGDSSFSGKGRGHAMAPELSYSENKMDLSVVQDELISPQGYMCPLRVHFEGMRGPVLKMQVTTDTGHETLLHRFGSSVFLSVQWES